MIPFERKITDIPVVMELVDRIQNYYYRSAFFMLVSRYPTDTSLLDGEVGCLFLEADGHMLPVVRVCEKKESLDRIVPKPVPKGKGKIAKFYRRDKEGSLYEL